MSRPVIDISGLSKTYVSYRRPPGVLAALQSFFHREEMLVPAVKGIDFTIRRGEFVGFLGPNGAGKTTTLKMLSGILTPTSGEATVLGYRPWERERAFQKRFAIVLGQKSQLWIDLPAMDSFVLNKEIYGISDRQFSDTVQELTRTLGIQDLLDVPVRKLSLGERMKAELVASLLHRPEVLLLDEPTIGLDVTSQLAIRAFLKRYNQQEKTTILLTSHYMEDVQALCKRVIVINHGAIAYDGPLAALSARTLTHKILTITFTGPVGKRVLAELGEIREHEPRRVVLHVPREQAKVVAAKLLDAFPVDDILIDEPPLDDVIRRVFEGPRHAS